MFVRALRTFENHLFVMPSGAVTEMPDALAREEISAGNVEEVSAEEWIRLRTAPRVETATVSSDVETASIAPRKRGKPDHARATQSTDSTDLFE